MRSFVYSLVLLIFTGTVAWSQGLTPQYYNPMDERFRVLALKKAKIYLEQAKSDYEEARKLYEKGHLSKKEYEQAKAIYEEASIRYQQAALAVIFEKPHITIVSAVKYRTHAGETRVKLTLKNTAGGSFLGETLGIEGEGSEKLVPTEIYNIFVSLKEGNTIISKPYERKIPSLKFGARATLDFGLLKDVDITIVAINYGDKIDEKKILLEQDASMEIVTIQVDQFSQETDLGEKATYNLSLERFSRKNNTYKLVVLNLPKEITYEFIDPQTSTRLSLVRFTPEANKKELSLALYLPDRATENVVMDKPIDFYAIVLDSKAQEELENLMAGNNNELNEKELSKIKAGKARLQLIPRGIGKLEIQAINLYHEIKPDEKVDMEIIVLNRGSRELLEIKLIANLPYNWEANIQPDLIPTLLPEKKQKVKISFIPPANLGVGDYEAKIKTTARSANRRIEAEDKVVRIHVTGKTNILGTLVLILVLIGIVVGVVIFGIRLSRR